MFSVLMESKNGEKPPERESGPSADGDPGRSTFERISLVSDDTQEYEDPQTGVSLVCNPTDEEIREGIRRMSPTHADRIQVDIVVSVTIFAVAYLQYMMKHGGSNWEWAALAVGYALFLTVMIVLYFRNLNHRKGKYRESGIGKVTIYPDRIELPERGEELPLDGTAELIQTPEFFLLSFPSERHRITQAYRYVILPLRNMEDDVLPYVEAMLVAGTRPREV
jgi:hypothetical protein